MALFSFFYSRGSVDFKKEPLDIVLGDTIKALFSSDGLPWWHRDSERDKK